jgi:nitrous oxidase accessory protein
VVCVVNKKLLLLVTVLVLLLVVPASVLLLLTSNSQPAAEKYSIQAAINSAQIGDTVFVPSGLYYECLVLNKSISLVGENRDATIIDGRGASNIIEILDNNVTIANLTIQHTGKVQSSGDSAHHGILIDGNSSGNIIINNTITDAEVGISHDRSFWLSEVTNNTIVGNNILNSWTCVSIKGGAYNTISQNRMENNSAGVSLDNSSHNVISENYINGTNINTGSGIETIDGNNNLILQNNIANNYFGIVQRGINNTVSENNISHNENGIWLQGDYNSKINGNNINDNTMGFLLYFFMDCTIFDNNIQNNENGMSLLIGTTTPSSNDTIFDNNFVENAQHVLIEGSDGYKLVTSLFWDNGSEGNYWSGYTGVDANHDGVGDTPYVLNDNNIDHYPLMSPVDIS